MKTRRDNNPATEERYLRAVERKTTSTEMIAATEQHGNLPFVR
jgi:hypothetical protein